MKRRVLLFFAGILLLSVPLFFYACQKYDDSEIRSQLGSLERRISQLESQCSQLNTNLSSLTGIVEAMRNNDYITSVTPVTEDGVEIGYKITFAKSGSVTVYHGKDGKDGADGKNGVNGKDGKDGKDGATPVIGVRKDPSDGLWYWTLNGEWMRDENGARVHSVGLDGKNGTDGKDGQNGQDGVDGITPRLKIENLYWWISYDNGKTWSRLWKAVGENGKDGMNGQDGADGDSFFQSINLDNPDYIVFTLSDGTSFSVPTQAAFDALTKRVNQINTNLGSLQQIVSALQANDFITSISPYMENGVQVGCQLYFSKSGAVIIYYGKDGKDGKDGADGANGADGTNGRNGKDGKTPLIGVQQDSDGIWYWTIDGDWLKDASGSRVKAVGADGQNGKDGSDGSDGTDGVTPQLKIEDRYWWISYDDGASWTQLEKAVDDGGQEDAFFKDVDLSDEHYVTFILADDTEFKIPRYSPVSIAFGLENNTTTIAAGETIALPYTLENATANTTVSASSDGSFHVRVEPGYEGGALYVTAPKPYQNGYVNVILDSGSGYTSLTVLNFSERSIIFNAELSQEIDATGGTITIPYSSNYDMIIEVSEGAVGWITAEGTAAAGEGDVMLQVAANGDDAIRTGEVIIRPANGDGSFCQIVTLTQSSPVFSLSRTGITVAAEGGNVSLTATSSLGLTFQIPASAGWITAAATSTGSGQYDITLTLQQNDTGAMRTCDVDCYSADGSTKLGSIAVVQSPLAADDLNALILEVRATVPNDYTVYLPIRGGTYQGTSGSHDSFVDCYIDWGDGMVEHFVGNEHQGEFATHTYSGLNASTSFDVRITGEVRNLSTSDMPLPYRQAIRAVRQWGQTGLVMMENAFESCQNLMSIPADAAGAFVGVTSFDRAFAECRNLTAIPEGLFVDAGNATSFDGVFMDCSGITSIPEDLFKFATAATNMTRVFSGCIMLTAIPENLFVHCPGVTGFNEAFQGCSSLTAIPEKLFAANEDVRSFQSVFERCSALRVLPANLFAHNSRVSDFSNAFYVCSSLEAIPESLFAFCPEVESFFCTFANCGALHSVPSALFDNNRKVINFAGTLQNGFGFTCESPYTLINGAKVHLYERKYFGDDFIAPVTHYGCFDGWFNAVDYYQIPESWGGGKQDESDLDGTGSNEGVSYENW